MPDTDRNGIAPEVLQEILVTARDAGFLGPGPLERHLLHAEGFVTLARAQSDGTSPRILDLGSGGGLPGLVVAGAWPESTLVLLESNERRAQFLERAVLACDLQDRAASNSAGRANLQGENAGRRRGLRELEPDRHALGQRPDVLRQ